MLTDNGANGIATRPIDAMRVRKVSPIPAFTKCNENALSNRRIKKRRSKVISQYATFTPLMRNSFLSSPVIRAFVKSRPEMSIPANASWPPDWNASGSSRTKRPRCVFGTRLRANRSAVLSSGTGARSCPSASARTESSSPAARTMAQCACGTRFRADRSAVRSRSAGALSHPSASILSGRSSLAVPGIARCAYGTCPRAGSSERRSRDMGSDSIPSASARTGNASPAVRMTEPCTCGTWILVG